MDRRIHRSNPMYELRVLFESYFEFVLRRPPLWSKFPIFQDFLDFQDFRGPRTAPEPVQKDRARDAVHFAPKISPVDPF